MMIACLSEIMARAARDRLYTEWDTRQLESMESILVVKLTTVCYVWSKMAFVGSQNDICACRPGESDETLQASKESV